MDWQKLLIASCVCLTPLLPSSALKNNIFDFLATLESTTQKRLQRFSKYILNKANEFRFFDANARAYAKQLGVVLDKYCIVFFDLRLLAQFFL